MISFSSIAVEWREKEAKKSNNFIIYSLVISSALHIIVLILGIGNFLVSKVPEIESEPIEVEIVEPPTEIAKQPEKQLPSSQSSGGGGGGLLGTNTQANTSAVQPNFNPAPALLRPLVMTLISNPYYLKKSSRVKAWLHKTLQKLHQS
ncbi:TonB-like protein [Calothrix sp. NIES-4071]|nr:TonB-like protein [Calothrix sp. NIES-4071]BAZ56503.1 TonB-like protein [Calothrix sp. NIES-4105]